jgi:hypothetical protein
MRKIPTIFIRDWNGDRSRVLPEPNPECAWVFACEGVATQKFDGTCCMIRGGTLYKRRELRPGDTAPPDFEEVQLDDETGKRVGWVPVGRGPDDRWHREAFAVAEVWTNGTYELLGPKVQGNIEYRARHELVAHAAAQIFDDAPRTFEGLKVWLSTRDIEGIVWHHTDGRMAKIKKRDFGLKR